MFGIYQLIDSINPLINGSIVAGYLGSCSWMARCQQLLEKQKDADALLRGAEELLAGGSGIPGLNRHMLTTLIRF